MSRHIKNAALASQQEAADARIRSSVESIIADVARRGDAAVREMSERFDKWSPPSFRLSEDEVAALVAKVAPQTIDDIKFAQAQIRRFAEIQRALDALMRGRTVLAIAHRLSTVAQFDRLVVLQGGRIVEDGTPSELRRRRGLFDRMCRLQEGSQLQLAS